MDGTVALQSLNPNFPLSYSSDASKKGEQVLIFFKEIYLYHIHHFWTVEISIAQLNACKHQLILVRMKLALIIEIPFLLYLLQEKTINGIQWYAIKCVLFKLTSIIPSKKIIYRIYKIVHNSWRTYCNAEDPRETLLKECLGVWIKKKIKFSTHNPNSEIRYKYHILMYYTGWWIHW